MFSPHVICHGFIVYHNLASIVTDYDDTDPHDLGQSWPNG